MRSRRSSAFTRYRTTARSVAVIPNGFQQPMPDYAADTPIGGTLRREMEEELFGRETPTAQCLRVLLQIRCIPCGCRSRCAG